MREENVQDEIREKLIPDELVATVHNFCQTRSCLSLYPRSGVFKMKNDTDLKAKWSQERTNIEL